MPVNWSIEPGDLSPVFLAAPATAPALTAPAVTRGRLFQGPHVDHQRMVRLDYWLTRSLPLTNKCHLQTACHMQTAWIRMRLLVTRHLMQIQAV